MRPARSADEEPDPTCPGLAPPAPPATDDEPTQGDASSGPSTDRFDDSLDRPTPLPEPTPGASSAEGGIPPLQTLLDRQMEAWLGGERLWVETILEEYPSLCGSEAVVSLLFNELALREAVGETPDKEEYRTRFPALEHRVRSRFFSSGEHSLHDRTGVLPPPPTAGASGPATAVRSGSATDVGEAAPDPPSVVRTPTDTGKAAASATDEIDGPPHPPADDPDTTSSGRGQFPSLLRTSPPSPSPVAGYEILGELGRGGMGVVYRARQTALNRVVALKMISGSGDVARFAVEAQAIARLQHPNIVQIYEIGERDGSPFFSLEYLEGDTLQKKLDGAPQPPMQAADLLETLARAVHFAHEHGIVHRDLKPANVLFARDGTPKITDFGLAKRLDDDLGQTATDAVLGTPTYMAPEQAEGKTSRVGPAADVYALGAILYDMLTGRPPFRGASVLDTLVLVRTAEPVPPRRLQPKVPVDLQTICLKCLEKDSFRRYASAAELADDLRALREGRSIHARPTSALERARKWARRRPAAAALVVVSALALLGLIAGLSYHAEQQRRLRLQADEQRGIAEKEKAHAEEKEREAAAQKARAEEKEREAVKEKARAEANEIEAKREGKRAQENFAQAKRAVEELTRAARRRLFNLPGMEGLRKDLLERVVVYYEEFARRSESDPALVLQTAQAYRRLGDMRELLNRPADAAAAYRKAAALFEALLGPAAQNSDVRADNAVLWKDLAGVRLNLWVVLEADPKEQPLAEESLRQARETLVQLARTFPDDERYLRDVAGIHNNQGIRFQRRTERVDPVSSACTLGLMAAPPGQGPFVAAAALLAGKARCLDDARAHYRLALETFGRLTHAYQQRAECQLEIARTEKNLGVALTADRAAAEAIYLQAADRLCHVLKRPSPDSAHRPDDDAELFSAACRKELGEIYLNLGVLKGGTDYDQALAFLGDAVDTLQDLAKAAPDVPEYRYLLATAHRNRGDLQRQAGKRGGAVTDLTTARRILEELRPHFRDNPLYRLDLARACLSLGLLHVAADGPTPEATAPWQTVMDLLEEGVAAPDAAEARVLYLGAAGNLIHVHDGRARQAQESRRWTEADSQLQAILGVLVRVVRVLPAVERRNKLASTRLALAWVRVGYLYDHKAAAAALADLPGDTPATWGQYRQAAAYLGRCMILADGDVLMSAADRRQCVRNYGDQCLVLLRRAVEHEWREMNAVVTAEEFALLRGRPEFQALVRELEWKRAVEPGRSVP